MKIINVDVNDPRRHQCYEDPSALVVVDEPVEEIGSPIFDHRKSQVYRVIPCGPFYAVEFRPNPALINWVDLEYSEGDLGEFNKLNLINDQLFPVKVYFSLDEHGNTEMLPLFMSVPRLRRLLRKYSRPYRLAMDEESALRGLLKWRLESSDPMCYGGAMPREDYCIDDPIQTIIFKGTHLPLCKEHLADYENRLRAARTANNH